MAGTINDAELELVMNTFIFKGASAAVVAAALEQRGCLTMEYKKGSVVFSTQDFFRALGVVMGGCLLVTKNRQGSKSLPISRLNPGEVFGAAAMFNDYSSFATVLTAETDCRIVYFSQELISRMMKEDFTIAENYIRYQSGRIRFLSSKIDGLSVGTAEARLARYLAENGGLGAVAATMSELADALNIGRASLYRALDVLCDEGAIVKKSRKIEIIDPDKLKAISERNG